jgi:hypothetical protein
MPGGRRISTQLGGIISFPSFNFPGAPTNHLHHQSISGVSCYGMHSGRRSLTSGGPLGAQFVASMEEDPVTDFVATFDSVAATLEENQAQEDHSHPAPDSYRLTDDHLVLIFEMRRDLAEQQHRQSFFNKRLDTLYDSLSSEPKKSHCPTCCHPFTFRLRQDGSLARRMHSFSQVFSLV